MNIERLIFDAQGRVCVAGGRRGECSESGDVPHWLSPRVVFVQLDKNPELRNVLVKRLITMLSTTCLCNYPARLYLEPVLSM